MRWERLFADLEGQIADEDAAERDALVVELVDEGWAETRWRDLVGGYVDIDVQGVGVLRGQVEVVSDCVLHISASGVDHFIAVDAVTAVMSTQRRASPTPAWQRRLNWVLVCRALQREGVEVSVTHRDGARRTGHIEHVGRDYVAIRTASGATLYATTGTCSVITAAWA